LPYLSVNIPGIKNYKKWLAFLDGRIHTLDRCLRVSRSPAIFRIGYGAAIDTVLHRMSTDCPFHHG
jgi:hypothetical protein